MDHNYPEIFNTWGDDPPAGIEVSACLDELEGKLVTWKSRGKEPVTGVLKWIGSHEPFSKALIGKKRGPVTILHSIPFFSISHRRFHPVFFFCFFTRELWQIVLSTNHLGSLVAAGNHRPLGGWRRKSERKLTIFDF